MICSPVLLPVKRLKLGPLLRLRLADEGQYRRWEDRHFTVEAIPINCNVTISKEVGFDYGFKCLFLYGFRHLRSSTSPAA